MNSFLLYLIIISIQLWSIIPITESAFHLVKYGRRNPKSTIIMDNNHSTNQTSLPKLKVNVK
ncbi:hypothetical protein DERP_008299 [Dermatophagoides pteronyssinus]|uniref:Uncharacterized protein n=1 Tax=Dermatophagoides pteronyssinus TaxID=6956 RepID=A0ABQ8J635_DERPT|nr:hypothetical protein DERP_008299 [Dermatophagoides pteronyssinus]